MIRELRFKVNELLVGVEYQRIAIIGGSRMYKRMAIDGGRRMYQLIAVIGGSKGYQPVESVQRSIVCFCELYTYIPVDILVDAP